MIKSLTKRIAVLMLCIATVLSAASLSLSAKAFAAEGEITRAEWLVSLVDTFEMTIEEDEVYPDNYFSDLDSSSDYYKKLLVAAEFGLINVEAGDPIYPDEPATRDFAASTLNFCLGFQLTEDTEYSFNDADDISDPDSAEVAVEREWLALINGSFSPQTAITSAEKDKMLSDGVEVWNSTEPDEDHEDTYKLKAGIKEVPEDVEAALLDENTLQITDCPVTISTNDLFVVHLNGIPVGYKAESVETNSNTLTIKVSESEKEDIFEELDIEGTLDGGALVFPEADEDENIEIYYEEEDPNRKISGSKKINVTIKHQGKIDLGDGVSAKVSAELSNITVKYKASLLDSYVKLTGTSKISAACEVNLADAGGFNEIPLTPALIPGVGGLDVVAEIGMSGKCKIQAKGYMETGVALKNFDFRIIQSFKAKQFSSVCEVSCEASLKARLGITDKKLPFEGYVYVKGGGEAHVVSATYPSGKPGNCKTYSAWVSASTGVKMKVKVGSFSESKEYYREIYNEKNSPIRIYHHYEDGREVAKCSRESDFAQYGKLLKYYTSPDSPYWSSGYAGANGYYNEGTFVPVFTFEKFQNEILETEARITGYTGNAFCLNIPDTVSDDEGEYKVTKIGKEAFRNRKDLYSLTIPDTVDTIEDNAFNSCSNLNMIIFPDSIVTIKQFAFAHCASLSAITLPEKVELIAGGAFGACDSLTNVKIPKSLKETTDEYGNVMYDYHYGIFMKSAKLHKITFEDGIKTIPCGVLANLPALTQIRIPDTVTKIGHHAFEDCENLKDVTLSNSLRLIEAKAFSKCSSIDEIIMPDTVTEVQESAFAYNTSLSDLVLSKNLTKVGGSAFGKCDSLTSVEIPKSIAETTKEYNIIYDYHYGVFMKCQNLSNVTFEEGIKTIPMGILAYTDGLKSITIPDSVTKIDKFAFSCCDYLENVTLSKNLMLIGNHSFNDCVSLKKLEMPDTVTQIDAFAFAGCIQLEDLHLSMGLKTAEGGIFAKCDALGTVTIPKTLTTVNSSYDPTYDLHIDYSPGLFVYSEGPKKIILEDGFTNILDGMLERSQGLTEVVVPDSVKRVGKNAFQLCPKLETVMLPDTINAFNGCFYNCVSLKNTHYPKYLDGIPDKCYYGCASLESINIPEYAEDIGVSAFEGAGLKTVEIPKSVEIIDTRAFKNNSSLTDVVIKSKKVKIGPEAFYGATVLKNCVLPEGLSYIGNYAFYDCDTLTDVVIPDRVTYVGKYAYGNCNALKSIKVGQGVNTIQEGAFSDNDVLDTVTLPLTLTSIDTKAFANDLSLKSIYIPRTVTSIANDAFSYYSQLTIYGVKGSYAETFANENGAIFIEKNAPATTVLIEPNKTMNDGDIMVLKLIVDPVDTTDEIEWISSNDNIVTVSNTGCVEAKGPGTATIKVYVGELEASCKITVKVPVTRISVYGPDAMDALDTYTLDVYVYPNDATDKTVSYESSDPEIVEVDSNGVLTAKKKGTATITVKALDGSGVKGTYDVTVANNGYIVTDISQFESEHNYANDCTDRWLYTKEGASNLSITFNSQTEFEDGFDYLHIYYLDEDGDKYEQGQYTGTELAGKTIKVRGDTVIVQLDTNSRSTAWGFKVDSVEESDYPVDPGDCDHYFGDYEYYDKDQHVMTCEYCGTKKFAEHDWEEDDDYLITPTLTKKGKMKYYCWECDGTKTEDVDPQTEGYCGYEAYYSFDPETGALTISGDYDIRDYDEGESPFAGETAIKSIVIEDDIYGIGENVFSGARNVESITLPRSLYTIGKGAFSGCNPKTVIYEGSEEEFSYIEMPSEIAAIFSNAEMEWGESSGDKEDISYYDAELEYTTTVYSGRVKKPKVYIDYLDEGFDYTVTYSNNINVGTASVTIKGIGDYTGTVKLTFRITHRDISDTDIALAKTKYVYPGSAVMAKLVSDNLYEDEDYELSYENNNAVGIATIIAEGKGNYKGTWEKTFTIVPKGTTLSKPAPAKKAITVKWKKQAVQTSGYEIQYGLKSSFKGAKIKAVNKASAVKVKLTKLKSKKKYYIRIRTFKKVGTKKYYSSWSSKKSAKAK